MEYTYVYKSIILEENPEIQIPIILGSGKGLIIRISSAIARKTHIDA